MRGPRPRPDLVPTHSAFVYVLDGAVDVGRLLLFAAKPIGEPVARSGPFVMNTEEELQRAWEDYRTGQLVQG